jgi:O-antigen ligase
MTMTAEPAKREHGWPFVGWFAAAAFFGGIIGLSLPGLMLGGLELYGVLLAAILFAALMLMPRRLSFSDSACWRLFVAALAVFAIYPSYISLQIAGLPWISPFRIMMAMLLFMWIYALRMSPVMAPRLSGYIRENRFFFGLLALFIACQFLSLPTSPQFSQALSKFLLFQLYWTFPFFAVLSLAATKNRLKLLGTLLIVFAMVQCLVGFLEARQERLLWLDYLPPGFGADSEFIQRIIQGQFRADGYRVQGSFSVSLVYAEFLVLMLPFAMFAFTDGKNALLRVAGLATAIAILPAQYLSGSRLGMVGSIIVFAMLGSLYVFRIWRADRRSMVGALMLLLLPVALGLFMALLAASPRLQSLTIGGGQHQASTDTRLDMWMLGLPKIPARPLFGYGPGLGADTLGYTNLAGVLTIDSYWLSALLEFGILGFAAFFGMIACCIVVGARSYIARSGEASGLGGPIAVALSAFIVIKLVLSQTDNHMLVFILMAMTLVVRGEQDAAAAPASIRPPPVPRRQARGIGSPSGKRGLTGPRAAHAQAAYRLRHSPDRSQPHTSVRRQREGAPPL